MACHELAALRLGLMNVLGRDDAAERQHELAELGDAADAPGPVRALCGSHDLGSLKRFYDAAVSALEERVSSTPASDPQIAYLRTLIVLTKKVEFELNHQIDNLTNLYRDLDEIHDFVHEIYPGE